MKTIHFTVVHTRYVGWTLSQDVRLMLKHPQGMTYVYIIRVLRDIVEGYSTKRALVTVCCANIITLLVLFRFRTKPLGHLMACRFFFQSIGNWNKSKIESIFKFLVADWVPVICRLCWNTMDKLDTKEVWKIVRFQDETHAMHNAGRFISFFSFHHTIHFKVKVKINTLWLN